MKEFLHFQAFFPIFPSENPRNNRSRTKTPGTLNFFPKSRSLSPVRTGNSRNSNRAGNVEQPRLELPSLHVKSGGRTRNSRCSSRDGEQCEASFGYSRFSRSRFPAGDAPGDPEAEILPLPAGGLRLPEHPGHRRLRVASLLHQQRSGAAGSVRPSRFSYPWNVLRSLASVSRPHGDAFPAGMGLRAIPAYGRRFHGMSWVGSWSRCKQSQDSGALSHRNALAAHPGPGPMDQQALRVLPAAGIARPGAQSTREEPALGTGQWDRDFSSWMLSGSHGIIPVCSRAGLRRIPRDEHSLLVQP